MSESNEIVVVEQGPAPEVHVQSLFDLGPRDKIAYATEVANVLKDVIKQQKLSVRIGPNEYVKSEAWATMGTILGILPKEANVIESENGDFIAYVELVRQADGKVVGGGSALCGVDEKRWAGADRYARRSMAVTRATGKAYRLAFAWIMTLAGYQPTPAEEMPEHSEPVKPTRKGAKTGFDINNSEHVDGLELALEKHGLPKDKWEAVANKMIGKSSQELHEVIKEFRQ